MKIDNSSEDRYKSRTHPAPTFVVKFGKNNRGVNEPLSPDMYVWRGHFTFGMHVHIHTHANIIPLSKSRAVSRHHMGLTRPRSCPEPISDQPMLTQATPNRGMQHTTPSPKASTSTLPPVHLRASTCQCVSCALVHTDVKLKWACVHAYSTHLYFPRPHLHLDLTRRLWHQPIPHSP